MFYCSFCEIAGMWRCTCLHMWCCEMMCGAVINKHWMRKRF